MLQESHNETNQELVREHSQSTATNVQNFVTIKVKESSNLDLSCRGTKDLPPLKKKKGHATVFL